MRSPAALGVGCSNSAVLLHGTNDIGPVLRLMLMISISSGGVLVRRLIIRGGCSACDGFGWVVAAQC
ncbi:MAG TPA: hypothetical protein VLI93_12350 [Acetobacteraceae bacterium]|nr:hypothetical protein [Acetobacteraceae bacterium]